MNNISPKNTSQSSQITLKDVIEHHEIVRQEVTAPFSPKDWVNFEITCRLFREIAKRHWPRNPPLLTSQAHPKISNGLDRIAQTYFEKTKDAPQINESENLLNELKIVNMPAEWKELYEWNLSARRPQGWLSLGIFKTDVPLSTPKLLASFRKQRKKTAGDYFLAAYLSFPHDQRLSMNFVRSAFKKIRGKLPTLKNSQDPESKMRYLSLTQVKLNLIAFLVKFVKNLALENAKKGNFTLLEEYLPFSRACEDAIDNYASYGPAWVMLAKCQMKKNFSKASAFMAKAVTVFNGKLTANAWNTFGELYYRQDDLKKADEHFNRAFEVAKGKIERRYLKLSGLVKLRLGHLTEAEELLDRAVAEYKNKAGAHLLYGLAQAKEASKKFKEANDLINRAERRQQRKPIRGLQFLSAARTKYELGEFSKSAYYFRLAVNKINIKYPKMYVRAAEAHFLARDYMHSGKFFVQAANLCLANKEFSKSASLFLKAHEAFTLLAREFQPPTSLG